MPSPTGIPTDPALTAHGVKQSEELGDHLLTLTPRPDLLYCSPYYRCLQTLAPGAKKLFDAGESLIGGRIRVENGVSEFFGHAPHFDHPSPAPLSELRNDHFPDLLEASYEPLLIPSLRGETIEGLHKRIAFVIHNIIEACEKDENDPKAILICTHAAVMIALGRVLTGMMPDDVSEDDFHCYTASLSMYRRKTATSPNTAEFTSVVKWKPGTPSLVPNPEWRRSGVAGGWTCVKNSDTSFLSGGAERGWRFFGDESFIYNPNAFNDVQNEQLDKDAKGSKL